jgi:subfamily B ATP-binding cassette protein MsbA
MEFLGYLLFAPFLLYANSQIGQGVSAGAFVAFIVALFKLYEPVRKLSRMHLHFEQAFACAGRVFEILEEDMAIKELKNAKVLPPLRKSIEFRGVSFNYNQPGSSRVLKNIQLKITKGEIVALVGKSGAGKSTLASLLLRFYDVTSGKITFDGMDIKKVTLSSLREKIAIVTQETVLFNDTVRNNILYGRLGASWEDVVEAAKASYIHDFIIRLKNGYNTIIGERGEMISGGQRQRIAVARAVLKKAPILILDEATSALDSASEKVVQRALQNLMHNSTTFVIAHRLSTIISADRIVVMENGKILEIGDHNSLLSQPGLYRDLYEMQSTEQLGESDFEKSGNPSNSSKGLLQ